MGFVEVRKGKSLEERRRLKPQQERAMIALLTARSVREAAREAKVGESTLRRWLREDEEFQTQFRRLRGEALSEAALRLQAGASEVVQTLHDLLQSKERIEPGRASLIRTGLDFAFRAGAYSDLAERIVTLENAAEENE